MSKGYGLIVPGKSNIKKPEANFSRPSIFGEESDSSDDGRPAVTIAGPGANQRLQAKKLQAKALEEDPTIFQYDELYDDMDDKRKEEKKAKSTEVKKAKYISKLLETAEKRKKEQERRIERTVQKEREAEGEMYKDKESFVTSAYRAKLEEMKKAEEAEAREEYLESIGDVTRQRDLGGFYRHIFEQQMGGPDKKTEEQEPVPVEKVKFNEKTKERSYRKRKLSQDEKEEDGDGGGKANPEKKEHLQSNLDADSDFSIDSSSDSEDEDGDKKETDLPSKVPKIENKKESGVEKVEMPPPLVKPTEDIKKEKETGDLDKDDDNMSSSGEDDDDDDESDHIKKKTKKSKSVSKKPKIDIWKKRTVGDILDAALERYYQRKAARESG